MSRRAPPPRDAAAHRGWLPVVLAGLAVLGLTGAIGYFVLELLSGEPPPPPKVQKISIVQPPPPPPPPPREEPPPEPEKQEIEAPEPEPVEPEEVAQDDSDEPPPGQELGLDAEGSGSGDGFGLVGRKGGRGLIGGSGGSRFAWYSGMIERELQSVLAGIEEVRRRRYTVEIRLRIAGDGSVRSVELLGTTGDPGLDRELERTLLERVRLSEGPPEDLPQPIRLRIRSRI